MYERCLAGVCKLQGRVQLKVACRSQRFLRYQKDSGSSAFGVYFPCGACAALVLRSHLQVLHPEGTHHNSEELVTVDLCRQMQQDRFGDLNQEKTLGEIPPEEPVRAAYGTASQMKK